MIGQFFTRSLNLSQCCICFISTITEHFLRELQQYIMRYFLKVITLVKPFLVVYLRRHIYTHDTKNDKCNVKSVKTTLCHFMGGYVYAGLFFGQ